MTTAIEVRPARREDADVLAALARRSFRDTFEALLPDSAMRAWAAADRERSRYESEWETMLVAVCGGDIPRGVAQLLGDELNGLWVDPGAQGGGVGTRLLEACESRLRASGATRIWLTCSARNARALAFYERHGFSVTGEQASRLPDGGPERLLVLEKPLGGPPHTI